MFLHQEVEARFIPRRHLKHDGRIAGRVKFRMPANRARPFRRSNTQRRIVQDEGSHVFWNPILVQMLRF